MRNVPARLHAKLRTRASVEGKTISDYVLDLLRRDLALPSQREWLETLARREPVEGVDIPETLEAARRERDAERASAGRR